MKLLQREVAELIGVDKASIFNFENNHSSPKIQSIPKIINFLGYIPYDSIAKDDSLGEKIVTYRKILGLNQKQLARDILKVDPTTLGRWERNETMPWGKFGKKIEDFFDYYATTVKQFEK